MISLYDLTREELGAMLSDEPSYRVEQVWRGLYTDLVDPTSITTLPRSLRSRLETDAPTALTTAAESTSADGMTVKWLWNLHDGAAIETVLMHYADRSTVCISTQAGCAMACGFCATGQGGFERNLSTGEIVEQVVRAARRSRDAERRVSNIVLMGMGEPMANYDRTVDAVHRIHDAIGISARHITISTVGIVPGIRRLADEPLPINLAVSLHAADDELRDELVPINRRYPIDELTEAIEHYQRSHNRRVSFEWALIDGVNDRDVDAERLAVIARRVRAHVNLIPLNRTPDWPTQGSPPARVEQFRDLLTVLGVNTTVRANRGTDIDAACGQLRASVRARGSSTTTAVDGPTRIDRVRGESDATD